MTDRASPLLVAAGGPVSTGLADGQARDVLGWKIVEYAALVVFAIVVPRMMGPERFGSFAALLALVGLLTLGTGLGGQATFGRFVPEYESQRRRDRVRGLFTQILLVRLAVAVPLAVGLVLLVPLMLPEAAGRPAVWGGGALVLAAVSLSCFQLFYGLNRLARWLARDALSKLVLVGFIVTLGGARVFERAAASLFLAELVFVALGVFWASTVLKGQRGRARLEGLGTHLRFGLLFFSANVLLIAIWRGGEVTVLLFSSERSEIGFFNIANAATMAFGALVSQLEASLMPSITTIHVAGDRERVEAWLGYSLKYLTIATVVFVLVVGAVGAWVVRLLLGPEYLAVVPNLQILVLGLLPVPLVRTAMTMAIVEKTLGRAITVGGGGFATFVGAAALLVPVYGALGASIAVAVGVALAGLISYLQFSLGAVLRAARYWRVVVPAMPALALTALPHLSPLAIGAVALATYMGLIVWARAVTVAELRRLVRMVA